MVPMLTRARLPPPCAPDVLAGRKTGGRSEGRQMINGAPKRNRAFARLMGYVEQFDAHNPQVRAGRIARGLWPPLPVSSQSYKPHHTTTYKPHTCC